MHSKSFETGFSDHHHMIYTILKSTFDKVAPKKITYRDYKTWSLEKFKQDLTINLVISHPTEYAQFENVFMKTLEANAPGKIKIIRANHKPHVNKELRKAIMKRTRLKNIANETKREEDIKRYREQRNLVVKVNTNTKRAYYKSIQAKSIENDKQFWKTVKPLFSNTNPMSEKITLIENGKILSNDEEVAECFNEYFINITDGMGIDPSLKEVYENMTVNEMVVRAVKKYEHHPSIKRIKAINQGTKKFRFSHVNPNEVMRQIEALDKNKSNSGKIPTSVLKATKEVACPFLTDCINSAIFNCRFPDELKEANVSPKFKSKDATAKPNFRPISVLPSVSKIYERVLKNQITPFFQDKLSVILSGFRECYSTQHALIRILELWRRCLDSSGIVGTILMDLSKAYDCLPHDLLIAKLEAYGFSSDSLQLVCSYLVSRYQRVKIGSCKSSRQKIKIGVPQGSVLGPLLFNIFINDLFAMNLESEICNFADDNTIFACGNNIQEIVIKLENDLGRLLDWFSKNGMIANPEKFQIMFLGLRDERSLRLNIEGKKLPVTDTVKLLGIQIDNKLKLNKHIHGLCSKVNQKVSAFARLNTYLSPDQATKICNTIILSNFNYCPLVMAFLQ